MFRGFEQAKIDDKGRLKVPARFRQKLADEYGSDVFMTIVRDQQLCIYPLKVWEQKETAFMNVPDSLPEKHRYILAANYFGTEKTVDEQGRLPIPPHLRDKAGLDGEVAVLGLINMLVVMNLAYADKWVQENFPTPVVFDRLKEYGI
jgi:MraZ protein